MTEPVPQIGEPVAGLYQMRRRRLPAVMVPVQIWYGPPLDPWDLFSVPPLARSWRWQALVNGELEMADFFGNVWTWCCGSPISQTEYDHLMARKEWAVEHCDEHPAAHPEKKIDMLAGPLPF